MTLTPMDFVAIFSPSDSIVEEQNTHILVTSPKKLHDVDLNFLFIQEEVFSPTDKALLINLRGVSRKAFAEELLQEGYYECFIGITSRIAGKKMKCTLQFADKNEVSTVLQFTENSMHHTNEGWDGASFRWKSSGEPEEYVLMLEGKSALELKEILPGIRLCIEPAA